MRREPIQGEFVDPIPPSAPSAPPPPPHGACVLSDGSCSLLTESACHANPLFVSWTVGIACPNVPPPAGTGACHLLDGDCYVTTEAACLANPAHVSWVEGSGCIIVPLPPLGSCVRLSDGSCSILTEAQCALLGPTDWTEGAACPVIPPPPNTGCCYLSNGQSFISTQAACLAHPLYTSWAGGSQCLSVPVPPESTCRRIATNQRGPAASIIEPSPHFTNTQWRGQSSAATGTHVRYLYESLHGGGYQQYIVLKNVVGTFIDDEVLLMLNADPPHQAFAINLPPGSEFKTRSAPFGGVLQISINCDTGAGTVGNNPSSGYFIYLPITNSNDLQSLYQILLADTYDDDFTPPTPALVTGLISGATAMFVEFIRVGIASTYMRFTNYTAGPRGAGFLPGEEFTISTVDPVEPFQIGNPTDEAVVS